MKEWRWFRRRWKPLLLGSAAAIIEDLANQYLVVFTGCINIPFAVVLAVSVIIIYERFGYDDN